jgi:uncharacterized membrane protein
MKSIHIRLIFFSLIILWCIGFSSAIFLGAGNSLVSNLFLKSLYSPVCHNLAEKSFFNLLVCSRCTGIYVGALLFSGISLLIKRLKPGFFIPALLFMLLDILLVNLNFYNYFRLISFSTGVLFGFTLFPYILSAIENSLSANETK